MKNIDSATIPNIFLGTGPFHKLGDYRFLKLKTVRAVSYGIRLGYGIDCAVAYGNHYQVGNGIRLSGKKRSEIFLTSKLYNNQQDNFVADHYKNMLHELRVDYVDLLLLHWPQTGTYIMAWKQMENLYEKQQVKYIGMANVELRHLLEMERKCNMLPQIIQVERHPLNTQEELISYCREKKILVQAYAPIGRMDCRLIENDLLRMLADKYNKTIPQVILRWHYQTGVIPVVRSIRPDRIRDNFNIWDFELTMDEMEDIMRLNINYKINDPRMFVRYY